MNLHRFLGLFILSLFSVWLTSCQGNQTKKAPELHHSTLLLASMYDHGVSPGLAATMASAENLETSIDQFIEDPTAENLTSARQALIVARSNWKKIKVFSIGAVASSFIVTRIETDKVNANFIQQYLESDDELDYDYVEKKGASSRGFTALEYLLFNDDVATTIALFTTDNLAQRRKDYLNALTKNIALTFMRYQDIWLQGGQYGETFMLNKGEGINTPMNELVNSAMEVLEAMHAAQLGKPLGADGNPADSLLLEAYRSGQSLNNLKDELASVATIYWGGPQGEADVLGLHDNLVLLNAMHGEEALADVISNQFKVCQEAFEGIPEPLSQAIYTDPKSVETAREELKKLIILWRVDLSSALGITLTINDSDGD